MFPIHQDQLASQVAYVVTSIYDVFCRKRMTLIMKQSKRLLMSLIATLMKM